jgi:hypothetical protein
MLRHGRSPWLLKLMQNCFWVWNRCDNFIIIQQFSTGPWCKPGDWVLIGRYSGSRIQIEGGEIKLLNDDEIIATVPDPEAILHQF